MHDELSVGGDHYSVDDALAIAIGYAFGTKDIQWRCRSGGVGPRVDDLITRRWLYQAYDCTPPDSDTDLARIDLVIADALNGQMRGSAIAGVIAIAPEVSSALRNIPQDTKFWLLPQKHIEAPPQGTPAWWVRRAWTILAGVPGVGVAVAHKTLHHKRPEVFPLLDRWTVKRYPDGQAWVGIHDELNDAPEAWDDLSEGFATFAQACNGIALSRLRLHDILLWTSCRDEAGPAIRAGQELMMAT